MMRILEDGRLFEDGFFCLGGWVFFHVAPLTDQSEKFVGWDHWKDLKPVDHGRRT